MLEIWNFLVLIKVCTCEVHIPQENSLPDTGIPCTFKLTQKTTTTTRKTDIHEFSVNGLLCLPHLSYGMLCRDLLGKPILLTVLKHSWRLTFFIVNRGDWLGSPSDIKGTNKDARIYVERSTTLHNLLFSPHTLFMNYVTNTFLLVSSSVRSKQLLCFVQGQGQKTEQ